MPLNNEVNALPTPMYIRRLDDSTGTLFGNRRPGCMEKMDDRRSKNKQISMWILIINGIRLP
jgi:hypothetical protein